jgi:hypothetical protein
MQPILIDGGQFAPQTLIEIVDDLGVALHHALRGCGRNRPLYLERF